MVFDPLFILLCGILTVIGMIILLRCNAFLSLLAAAFLVSFMTPIESGDWGDKVTRVANGLGTMAGRIGILIAMGSVIGKCMIDSGSADRIIRSLRSLFGERLLPASMLSGGFILSIPVFYEATFYLMVPIAKSVYKATKKNYILYLMAIGLGATMSHTLVPPTPGPVAAAVTLNVPIGMMMLVGALVGILTTPFALGIAAVMNRLLPNPEIHQNEDLTTEPQMEQPLPSIFLAYAPILVPVVLIAMGTILATLEKANVVDWHIVDGQGDAPALRNIIHVLSNTQMAMIMAALVAMVVLVYVRKLSFRELERRTESALIDAGLIILIVSAGGAFGEMLRTANVGDAVKNLFQAEAGLTGITLLCVAFGITAMIKTAQGSSTAAMITTAAIFSGIVFAEEADPLPYNVAYLAVAIGLGSCVTGWMNDGGFWLFCRIGGIKETDALKTWTVGLVFLGLSGLLVVIVLSQILPLVHV